MLHYGQPKAYFQPQIVQSPTSSTLSSLKKTADSAAAKGISIKAKSKLPWDALNLYVV